MKKLFSAVAISFVLSGCMNNVSLPNANTPMQPSNQTNTKYKLMDQLAKHIYAGELCGFHYPKDKKVWNELASKLHQFALTKFHKEPEYSQLNFNIVIYWLKPYMLENNIPLTIDSYAQLHDRVRQDNNLQTKVLQAALKTVPKKECSIKQYKNMLNKTLKSS